MKADIAKLNEMAGRGLLRLTDITDTELLGILDLAAALKNRPPGHDPALAGKSIALLFEKASTRTRCAAAVAMASEGGHAEYLSGGEIHLGKKESVVDTARVLGRMFSGIMFRGYGHSTVEKLADAAGVPVWNGLTDEYHPTQALAGLMTVREYFGRLRGLKFAYVGDGRNNVATSFMYGCAKAGLDCCVCAPANLAPAQSVISEAGSIAQRNGALVSCEEDPARGVEGANVVYTDVWASMGEEHSFQERIDQLKAYQVNMELMRHTGNLDAGKVVFLHCLPAYHDGNTEMSKESGALEVTDDVFEADFSMVFDEAENRMHTIKALLVAGIGQ